MGIKAPNAVVTVNYGESISSALSRFKKKCRGSGMHNVSRKYHVSRSEKRRAQKHLAESRRRKQDKKSKKYQLYKEKYQKGYA